MTLQHPHRRRSFLTILVAVCAMILFMAIRPLAASASTPVSLSGAYVGGGNASALTTFANWRGSSATVALDYLGFDSWSEISNPDWLLQSWQGFHNSGGQLVLSVPMLVSDGSPTFAAGAAGAYDSYFETLGNDLVASGYSSAVIRLGWEFNDNAFPWAIQAGSTTMGPTAFIADWRHIVDLMRSISGSHFKFDWTVNNGPSSGGNAPAEDAYPGDDYVDYIGDDVYDVGWAADGGPINDPATRWQQIVDQTYGLNWWAAFAQAHNKPITLPEWGLQTTPGWSGGGDDPYFIQAMHTWIQTNHPAYETYFDYAGSALTSQNAPQSAALYQTLWGVKASAISAKSSTLETVGKTTAASTSSAIQTTAVAARNTHTVVSKSKLVRTQPRRANVKAKRQPEARTSRRAQARNHSAARKPRKAAERHVHLA